MDDTPLAGNRAPGPPPDTTVEQQRRLTRERQDIAKADADIAAGRLVDASLVRTWVESIDTDHELPVPYSGR